MKSCYEKNINILANTCSLAECYNMVVNPEGNFSHDADGGGGGGGLNAFKWYQIFALNYVLLKHTPYLARIEAS